MPEQRDVGIVGTDQQRQRARDRGQPEKPEHATHAGSDVEEMNDAWDDLVQEYFKLKKEFELKLNIIDNLVKVIKSQEDEIAELNKANHYQQKRRNWHY